MSDGWCGMNGNEMVGLVVAMIVMIDDGGWWIGGKVLFS